MRGWFGRLGMVLVCVSAFDVPAVGANRVEIESKCVAPGATGVTVGVFIENDEPLTAMTLPLEVRSKSEGAYITNTFDFDTLPGGRVGASGLSDFITQLFHPNLNTDTDTTQLHPKCRGDTLKSYGSGNPTPVDFFTSPDAVSWTGIQISGPSLAPGDDGSTPSFIFTFDVNSSAGVFEIDTCCIAPSNHLNFVKIDVTPLLPAFTKGVITVTTTVPEWDSIGVIVNAWGDSPAPFETATLSVSATDPDCDSLTLTALFLPSNSEFVQTGRHTGLFTFTPDSSQSLTNGTMLFIVGDERGADTSSVEWVVTAWSAVRSAGGPIPESYVLEQNFPNPFNAGTVIPFSVGQYGHVRIAVYNILGNRVAMLVDEELAPGRYTADWDGRSSDGRPVATGIYFYRISTDAHVATRKMLFLK